MENGAQPWRLADPSEIQVSLESEPQASREARSLIDGLRDLLPGSVVADLRSVVSELVNNCVVHGTGHPIDVRVDVTTAGDVHGRIGDGGTGTVALGPPRAPGKGGLGLKIVDTLVTRWGVRDASSDVWFEMAAPVPAPSPIS